MTIQTEKDRIRVESLAARSSVAQDVRTAFAGILADLGLSVLAHRASRPAPVVAAFWPIRDEPDTSFLIAALSEAGVATALPVTPPRGEPLRFRSWRVGDALVAGRFGTVEPGPNAAETDPDLLFVPLAAFDRRGYRLGYGAGYYDGALTRLRLLKPIRAVGVAYAAQEVGAVPTEPHDQKLDALLTENGLLEFGPH